MKRPNKRMQSDAATRPRDRGHFETQTRLGCLPNLLWRRGHALSTLRFGQEAYESAGAESSVRPVVRASVIVMTNHCPAFRQSLFVSTRTLLLWLTPQRPLLQMIGFIVGLARLPELPDNR